MLRQDRKSLLQQRSPDLVDLVPETLKPWCFAHLGVHQGCSFFTCRLCKAVEPQMVAIVKLLDQEEHEAIGQGYLLV